MSDKINDEHTHISGEDDLNVNVSDKKYTSHRQSYIGIMITILLSLGLGLGIVISIILPSDIPS